MVSSSICCAYHPALLTCQDELGSEEEVFPGCPHLGWASHSFHVPGVFSTYQEQAPCQVAGKAKTEKKRGREGGSLLRELALEEPVTPNMVCVCLVQAPHCLLHGLPGPWALDWTPGDLPSIWSWGGLIEIFHVFETLHERLACGRRSQPQPCLLGGLPVGLLLGTLPRPPGSSPPTWEVPVPSFPLVPSFFQAPQSQMGSSAWSERSRGPAV